MLWKVSFFLGNWGILGLTEDADKFRRWQICSTEPARDVSQFEDSTVLNENFEFHCHEDSKSFQEKFAKHVSSLTKEFNQPENLFEADESNELIQLGTKDVLEDDVVPTVSRIKEVWRKQHNESREMRIFSKNAPFDDPIKKDKLPTFKTSNIKGQSAKSESKDFKIHVRLSSQMYISSQICGKIC